MTLLTTEALHFSHGQARDPVSIQGVSNIIEFKGFDDRFDELHRLPR
jgi:hypothetical protein